MFIAVGLRNRWTAAEAKICVQRVAERPTAAVWTKPEDLFADGLAWIGWCRLDACQGGWRRRRFDEAGGRRGVAVSPDGDSGGGGRQLDIGGPNLPCHQELEGHHNTRRDSASAALPPPNISFASVEPLCGGALLDSERVERLVKFGRGRGAWASPEIVSKVGRCFLPSRVA